MRYQGKIVKWYDDKGFGFIRATNDSKDIFFHISDIHQLKKRPEIDELVTYDLREDERGRFNAINVGYLAKNKYIVKSTVQSALNPYFLVFFLLFCTFVIERTLKGFLPAIFLFIFFGANLVVFLFYYQDKVSANKNEWRITESTLHLFSLVGGWGGAYIAQKTFSHKHKKASFMFTYKITILINCTLITLYAIPILRELILTWFKLSAVGLQ